MQKALWQKFAGTISRSEEDNSLLETFSDQLRRFLERLTSEGLDGVKVAFIQLETWKGETVKALIQKTYKNQNEER